ncbi:MAG: magnesium and cobalt transport protein CorA [Actinomadura sp.]
MIVDCAIYRDGRREDVEGDISDALDVARGDGEAFLWIGLHEPEEAEFDLVKDELRLNPLAVQDAVQAHQRPKLEHFDDTTFVVVKTLRYVGYTATIEVGEIMLFVGPDFVITVRHGEGNPLTAVRNRLEKDPELLGCGPSAVLYAVCDEIVDTYSEVAHEVEANLVSLERRVFDSRDRHVAEEIYSLKREVLKFRAAEDPLTVVLQRVTRNRAEIHPRTEEHFGRVLDRLLRVDGAIDSQNELLTSILNAHLAQVGVRQNDDMRKISAWAAIIAVPTMIAGIYGMNFEHMPELRWVIGYPLVLIVMVVVCLLVHRKLRQSGWL